MALLDPDIVLGSEVALKLTNPAHIGRTDRAELARSAEEDGGFGAVLGEVLMEGVDRVNRLQQESFSLSEAFITNPDSVDSHDVTIALQKANMSLQITKAVVDGALQAYREIINLR